MAMSPRLEGLGSVRMRSYDSAGTGALLPTSFGGFLAGFQWDWFITLTFADKCSISAARAAFRRYAALLSHDAGVEIYWFRVDEIGGFGRLHQHALVGNVGLLNRSIWENRWHQGHARILSYDPLRGAAYYISKSIGTAISEFEFSDDTSAFRRAVSRSRQVETDLGQSLSPPCPLSGQSGEEIRMTAIKNTVKGEVLRGVDQRGGKLAEQAAQLDRQIRTAVTATRASLTELGALLAEMKDRRLWQYLPLKYRRWDDYAQAVLGPMARSKLYEMLAAHTLTQGSNPLPARLIEKMGIKKSAELARLEPSERTPEMVQAAVEEPLPILRKRVQDRINETLPADERKEVKIKFIRSFAPAVIERYEKFMKFAIWMEGVRDGDRTLTLEEKVLIAMIDNFQATFAAELEEAEEHLAELEAAKCGPADRDASEQKIFALREREDTNGVVIPRHRNGGSELVSPLRGQGAELGRS